MGGMADLSKQIPTERKRGNQMSSLQVMFAAILAIGLLLAINFSSRITAGQPLHEAHARVETEIEQLRREQASLMAERDFVRSDAFVERWVRDEGKMVREGEVLVIPVPSASGLREDEQAQQLSVPVQTIPPRPDAWQVWWALFFDGPPPTF